MNELNVRPQDQKMIELVKMMSQEELYLAIGVVFGKRLAKTDRLAGNAPIIQSEKKSA